MKYVIEAHYIFSIEHDHDKINPRRSKYKGIGQSCSSFLFPIRSILNILVFFFPDFFSGGLNTTVSTCILRCTLWVWSVCGEVRWACLHHFLVSDTVLSHPVSWHRVALSWAPSSCSSQTLSERSWESGKAKVKSAIWVMDSQLPLRSRGKSHPSQTPHTVNHAAFPWGFLCSVEAG